MANAWREGFFLGSIKENGRKLSKEAEIKEGVVNALYSIWMSMSGLPFSSLGVENLGPLRICFLRKRFSQVVLPA